MQAKSGGFVEVRVGPSDTQTTSPKCQLRHPSGWVIDCGYTMNVHMARAAGEIASEMQQSRYLPNADAIASFVRAMRDCEKWLEML
jgi:hypothetical protein